MHKVLESVAITGGASINTIPAAGYMVSRAGSDGLSREHLEGFAQAYHEELDSSDTYLGVWEDDETGLVYLDISDNLDMAVALGAEREQLAVYAVEQGETILGSKRDWIRSRRYATRRDRRIPRSRSSRSAGRALDCWNCA